MNRKFAPATAIAAAILLTLAGCARVKDHQGYVLDETLVAAIQPGVDTRDSVLGTLGRPTFTGQFSPDDWYYVSRDTRNLAFRSPRPNAQTILRVRFSQAGTVEAVDRRGMEAVASIDPMNDKTPTLGRNTSLLEELFGNIGAVGATGERGRTADDPQ